MRLKFFSFLAIVLVGLVFFLAPAQLPVIIHKFALEALAAVMGYWLDRHLFPLARPHMVHGAARDSAMLRRAIIVGATLVAVALAL